MLCRKLSVLAAIRISTRNARLFSNFSRTSDDTHHVLSSMKLVYGSSSGISVCVQKLHLRHFSFGSVAEKVNPKSTTISFELDNSQENVLNTGDVISETSGEEILTDKANFNIDNFLGEASNSISESNLDAANVAVEALNLTPYLPPDGIYHLLTYLHQWCPWWASIVAATCIIRIITLPLIISIQKSSTVMAKDSTKMLELQQKMAEAMQRRDEAAMMVYNQQAMQEVKKSMGTTLRFLWKPVLNGTIFTGFFFSLREMANLPIVSMKTGGLYWFTDLTLADPYCILPLITSTTLYGVFKSGIEFGKNPMMETQMKWMSYILPPVSFIFMINFPSALCVYWCTNNFISLLQSLLLSRSSVRKFFNIPELPTQMSKMPIKNSTSFKQGFNQSWNQAAFSQAVKERKELYDKLTSIKQTK